MEFTYWGGTYDAGTKGAVAAQLIHRGETYRMASVIKPGYENHPMVVYKHCRRLQNFLSKKAGIKKPVDFLSYEGQTDGDYIFRIADTGLQARVSKEQYADIKTARQAARFVVLQVYRGV